MALLHVAQARAQLAGTTLEAVTVDHGLRAQAADEAAMVAAYCASHDIPHSVLEWDGAAATGNIAAAGRDARYDLIANWAKMRGVGGVLLGHTLDDIAETFLMRLARKAGVDGLAMMDTQFERHGMRWSRPFWQQSRTDLRDYLRRHNVPWVDDPTNDDETHDRPKARKALDTLDGLGITREVLKSVAMNMSGARSALEHYTIEEARRVVREDRGDVIINTRALPPVPPEINRRLLSAALQYVGSQPYAPRSEAMVELDCGLAQAGKHTLAGCLVTSDQREIRVTREFNAVKAIAAPLGANWDRRWQVLGPVGGELSVRALGEHIKDIPDWRETGLPRSSLIASPAVFKGDWLIAAPVAGLQNGFGARIVADFESFLLSR